MIKKEIKTELEQSLDYKLNHLFQGAEGASQNKTREIAQETATEWINNQLNLQNLEKKLEPVIKNLMQNNLKMVLDAIPKNINIISSEPEPEIKPQGDLPEIPPLDEDFYFDPKITQGLLAALSLKKNILISGPTGCGKSQIITQLHSKLGKPLKRINMHGDVTMGTFLGNMKIENQETKFELGAVPKAMLGGYTLLVDEIDYTPAHIAAILNPVLEPNGKLYIPETGETITPRKGFLIAATGNSGGKGDQTGVYTGIEVLNTAFLDRFGIKMNMDYLPNDKEIELLQKKFPKETPGFIASITSFASGVRQAFMRQELSATLSTRKLIDLMELRQNGFDFTNALDLTFRNWLDDDDRQLVSTLMDRLFDNEEPK